MARVSHQQRIADHFGKPFWTVLREHAEQGLTRSQTAKALNMPPGALYQALARYPERDPFPPVVSIIQRYYLDTGETFRDACIRMAPTHLLSEAARTIGYADVGPFRNAMHARGIYLTFPTRTSKRTPPC